MADILTTLITMALVIGLTSGLSLTVGMALLWWAGSAWRWAMERRAAD